MTSLVLMYVYYDSNGDIKAITPLPEAHLTDMFSLAMFPISVVESFLNGKKNPFDYYINRTKKISGETYQISKKQSNISLVRTLDTYLSKIPGYSTDTIFKISADIVKEKITLKLDPAYKELYIHGTDEQKEDIDLFVNSGKSYLYFTKENNPHHLFQVVHFSPQELFEQSALLFDINENIDLSRSSVYTKRLLTSYGYYIKGSQNV